jgi:hypothetical protein
MSSAFVCLSPLSLLLTDSRPIQNTVPPTSYSFLSPPAPQNTTFLTFPSLSQESSLFILFSCFSSSTFSLPITFSVPSFPTHPENSIWLYFSSLCTYCCSSLSSENIVSRSDLTTDIGIGFILKIQDF